MSSRPHPKMGLTGVSSCLAGREWILLSSLLHHVLFRRHVGLLTSGCSTRGQFPIPTHQQLAPRSPFTSFQPTKHNYPKGYRGENRRRTTPHLPGGLKGINSYFPTQLPLSPPLPKGLYSKRVCRDIQCGGLNTELVSGSGTPPFILPTPSPQERPTLEAWAKDRARVGQEGEGRLERRNTVPLWMEARPGMRLTLKSGSIRRIGGCGVYKNLGGLGLDERDDLLGEGQVLLG